MNSVKTVDVLVVGASLSGAAAAKRVVDAGLDAIAIDFRKLPRHKICSGIISPRGHRFLIENFGPLPRETLHEPTACRGVTFHFPSMISIPIDFEGGPTPHLNRKYSDYWAIKKSGIQIADETAFVGMENDGKMIRVHVKHQGRPLEYRARYLIGADGPNSPVRRSIYPEYKESIPWFMVGQKFHQIVDCPLDEAYFHFWFHSELGHYTWSHARDGRQIVGVGFPAGGNMDDYHKRVETYLRENHGVHLKEAEDREGCAHNFGPSLINRYVFGKGNVLVTGQAAGFFNMLAEGMSCALHSGAIAGESIVDAIKQNRSAEEVYRKSIVSEVNHCTDQWNIIKMLFANPHEADFKKELKKLGRGEQLKVILDIAKFLKIYGPFNWGRQMLGQSLRRAIFGSYSEKRWL